MEPLISATKALPHLASCTSAAHFFLLLPIQSSLAHTYLLYICFSVVLPICTIAMIRGSDPQTLPASVSAVSPFSSPDSFRTSFQIFHQVIFPKCRFSLTTFLLKTHRRLPIATRVKSKFLIGTTFALVAWFYPASWFSLQPILDNLLWHHQSLPITFRWPCWSSEP
jgi:hypothetical protein